MSLDNEQRGAFVRHLDSVRVPELVRREASSNAAEHSTAGRRHNGILIALSGRFSRRLAGLRPLVDAVQAVAEQHIEDRDIYLERAGSG